MKLNKLHLYLIAGAVLIASFLVFQVVWSVSVYQSEEKKYQDAIWETLYEVSDRLAEASNYDKPSREPVIKVRDGFYTVELNEPLGLEGILIFLRESAKENGVDVPFDLGVYTCGRSHTVGVVKYFPGKEQEKIVDNQFFEGASEELVYFFGVKFPASQAFLWSKAIKWSLPLLGFFLILVMFVWIAWVVLKKNRLFEMQKDFINNMAHEFKTPIASIGIVAEAFSKLDTLKENKRYSKYLKILNMQNQHLNNQVDRVLQIATIEKQELPLEWEVLQMTDVVGEALDCFEEQIAQRDGQVILDIPVDTYVKADKTHFLNMLHNLLDNALKYSVDEPIIKIYIRKEGDRISLVIEDNGIGISEKHLKFIFNKFYRVPTGNTHNVKGFGLGLYYIYKMAKVFQWELSIQSYLSQGTSITLNFPETEQVYEKESAYSAD